MAANAERCKVVVQPHLQWAMQNTFSIQTSSSDPAGGGVSIADGRCSDVANLGICEWMRHRSQITGLRSVVSVELNNHVVPAIAVMVIEECEVPFLAATAPGPSAVVVVRMIPAG